MAQSNKGDKKNNGFTLIELLVVIAIIGILSSVVLVSLNKARGKARDSRRIAEIEQLIKAITAHKSTKGVYPGDADNGGVEISSNCNSDLKSDLKNAGYLQAVPEDPLENANCSDFSDDNFFYGWDSAHCCEGSECISINRLETEWAVKLLAQKYPDHDNNLDNGVQYSTGGGDANIGTGDDFNYCFIDN